MKKLTKEEQIEILIWVRDVYLNEFSNFICNGIQYYAKSLKVSHQIPVFTFANVKRICKENGLPLPIHLHEDGGGWWPMLDLATRIKVINLLIEQLKK